MDCTNFNCVLCPMMDRLPCQTIQSKNAKAILNMNKELDLLDKWRHYNPLSKQYISHYFTHFFVSKFLIHLVEHVDIGHIALSDHAPVSMSIQPRTQ